MKIFYRVIFALIYWIFILSNANALMYETEPNNDMSQADEIVPGEPIKGQTHLMDNGDWFSFQSTGNELISVSITDEEVSDPGRWEISIRNSNDDIFNFTYHHTSSEETVFETAIAESGTYYVVVYGDYTDYYYFLTISGSNLLHPPSANAGPDKVVFDRVFLDASQSFDPDGNIVSYSWELLHRVNSDYDLDGTGKTISFSSLKRGIYEVFLTVMDNDGFTDTDQMTVAVLYSCPAGDCNTWEDGYLEGVDAGLNQSYNSIAGIIEEDASGNKVIEGTVVIKGDLILKGD